MPLEFHRTDGVGGELVGGLLVRVATDIVHTGTSGLHWTAGAGRFVSGDREGQWRLQPDPGGVAGVGDAHRGELVAASVAGPAEAEADGPVTRLRAQLCATSDRSVKVPTWV